MLKQEIQKQSQRGHGLFRSPASLITHYPSVVISASPDQPRLWGSAVYEKATVGPALEHCFAGAEQAELRKPVSGPDWVQGQMPETWIP